MQWNKRYWNIVFKLYVRRFRKSPHLIIGLLMAQVTFVVATVSITHAYLGKPRFGESTFTTWKKVQRQNRKIASSTSFACEFNEITIEKLQQEISALEAKYQTGHNIQGEWKGIDLQNLPSIQAQFIADYGHLIGDQNKSYNLKKCNDVACVLNAIYLDSTNLSGYLSYYWYLKTGSMLSMSNIIPRQNSKYPGEYNGKVHNYRDYLFSKVELESFYKLAKSLPSNFLHNPLLKSIHKLPNNSPVVESTQNPNHCALSFPTGQIVINNNCMDNYQGKNAFFINVANQMAKYLDHQVSSVSSSSEWHELGPWHKEEFWSNENNKYQYQWSAHLKPQNLIGLQTLQSPSEYLTRIIANFRFAPEKLMQQTPPEISNFVAQKFYHQNNFTEQGLYKQYLSDAFDLWSQKEQILWSDCIKDYLKPQALGQGTRDLASDLEDPLFSCIESKVPLFIENIVSNIKKDHFEGCNFFSNSDRKYYSDKFNQSLDKLIKERILLRKIELKKFGEDVLVGHIIKNDFEKKIDPVSVYINCYSSENKQHCYNKTIDSEVKVLLKDYIISSDYALNIKSDISNIYNFNRIDKRTNEIGKQFTAPYYSQVKFKARNLWEQCKSSGPGSYYDIKLPMEFTGNKYYINAKFLNCINNGIEGALDEVMSYKTFQKVDNNEIEFTLNDQEKKFALSFLKPKFLQTLNNILDEQVVQEKSYLNKFFEKNQSTFLTNLNEYKDDFLEVVYSADHLSKLCLEKVKDDFPTEYLFQTQKQIDTQYGRSICSQFAQKPEIVTATKSLFKKRWEEHMESTNEIFLTGFKEKTYECYNDYPITGRRDPQTDQIRVSCINLAFENSLIETIDTWKNSENVEYFFSRKNELFGNLKHNKQKYIRLALNHKL